MTPLLRGRNIFASDPLSHKIWAVVVVVVKWSASSTLIRVRILLMSTVLYCNLFEKNEKRGREWPIKKQDLFPKGKAGEGGPWWWSSGQRARLLLR